MVPGILELLTILQPHTAKQKLKDEQTCFLLLSFGRLRGVGLDDVETFSEGGRHRTSSREQSKQYLLLGASVDFACPPHTAARNSYHSSRVGSKSRFRLTYKTPTIRLSSDF